MGIGRTMNLRDRIYKYKQRSSSSYLGPEKKYHIHRAFNKYGLDAFEFNIIAICKTEREAKSTEIFWQLYYNRENSKEGFDLNVNKYFNPIIGDRYRSLTWYNISKYKPTQDVLRGLTKGEIKNKYQLKSYKTLNKRFQKYFDSINLFQVRAMLLKPILRNCIEKGYKIEKTLSVLAQRGIDIFRKSKNPKRLISERYCHYLWDKSYYNVRLDLFVKPYICYLKKLDLDEFIDDRKLDKLGIIEYVILADIELQEIVYGLELCFKGDSYQKRKKARHKIENYLRVRFHEVLGVSSGENKPLAVKNFIKSNYMEKSLYNSYLKDKFSIK